MDSTLETDVDAASETDGAHSKSIIKSTKQTMEMIERAEPCSKSSCEKARGFRKCCKRGRRLLVFGMLMLHYMLYNVAFSLIGPFFPDVVSLVYNNLDA